MKKVSRFSHTPKTKKGLGDFYGTGIKAKLGRVREGMGMVPLSKKQMGTAPRSLA